MLVDLKLQELIKELGDIIFNEIENFEGTTIRKITCQRASHRIIERLKETGRFQEKTR